MFLECARLTDGERDKLLHSTIVPRPIAWVSTEDEDGNGNLAPFSFFNVFSCTPPVLGIGIGRSPRGGRKDTLQNILSTREFVVHLVNYANREAMVLTAVDFDEGVDEMREAGLETEPSRLVRPRRLAGVPVAMECRLFDTVPLGEVNTLVLGEVLAFHLAPEIVADPQRLYIDAAGMDLIARMHGSGWYSRTDSLFRLPRFRR